MFKSIFFFIISAFKRALCCFRRRKRVNDFVPLTQVGVVSDQSPMSTETENWSDWNEPILNEHSKPNSVQEHIEYYRQQAIAARQIKEEVSETQENFFDDMTPRITKQPILYINEEKEESNTFNKLSLAPDSVNILSQELEEWDEDTGWEDQTLDVDAREALKETRRQARQKKLYEQQQRKQEKFARPVLGSKVYS